MHSCRKRRVTPKPETLRPLVRAFAQSGDMEKALKWASESVKVLGGPHMHPVLVEELMSGYWKEKNTSEIVKLDNDLRQQDGGAPRSWNATKYFSLASLLENNASAAEQAIRDALAVVSEEEEEKEKKLSAIVHEAVDAGAKRSLVDLFEAIREIAPQSVLEEVDVVKSELAEEEKEKEEEEAKETKEEKEEEEEASKH